MKLVKKIVKWFLFVVFLTTIILCVTNSNYIFKAVKTVYLNGYTTAFIKDYEYFDNAMIKKSKSPQPWPLHQDFNTHTLTKTLAKLHEDKGTVAFLVIKNDSILFEKYYDGYSFNSKSNSFSMAKSYVCALLGKAIKEGFIKSLNQPVCDFIPQYCEGVASKVTVGDLASMASGSSWIENYYTPINITTRAYYGKDLKSTMSSIKTIKTPGKSFEYSSGDTQLLGIVIEKATGKKLYNYLSESLWGPLGSESDALWQLDSKENDVVKSFCCIASNARDFARLGKLYKDHGNWNGKQILDSVFVKKSISPRFDDSPQYGYGFWLQKKQKKSFFMMEGHLGQSVIVEPSDNLIIVRLGHKKEFFGDNPYNGDINIYIEETYKMLSPGE